MRRSIFAAALVSLVACTQPPGVQTAPFPSDQPLSVRLHQPIGGTLHYSLSEPAYVAIFAVSRGYGTALVFPHYQSQAEHRSHAGLNQETVHGARGPWGYSTVSRSEARGMFGDTDAYYIIASKSPLPVEAILQAPYVLRTLVGERIFRASNFAETWGGLEELLVADLPDEDWASDAYITWRDPFLSVAYSEPTFLHCQGRRSFYIPGLSASDLCNQSYPTRVYVTPAPPPLVAEARRTPPDRPRDRDPMLPLEPPKIGPDHGVAQASRNSEASRLERHVEVREMSRPPESPRAAPARPVERAPAARDNGPGPSRPSEARPAETGEGSKRPDPQPDN